MKTSKVNLLNLAAEGINCFLERLTLWFGRHWLSHFLRFLKRERERQTDRQRCGTCKLQKERGHKFHVATVSEKLTLPSSPFPEILTTQVSLVLGRQIHWKHLRFGHRLGLCCSTLSLRRSRPLFPSSNQPMTLFCFPYWPARVQCEVSECSPPKRCVFPGHSQKQERHTHMHCTDDQTQDSWPAKLSPETYQGVNFGHWKVSRHRKQRLFARSSLRQRRRQMVNVWPGVAYPLIAGYWGQWSADL